MLASYVVYNKPDKMECLAHCGIPHMIDKMTLLLEILTMVVLYTETEPNYLVL